MTQLLAMLVVTTCVIWSQRLANQPPRCIGSEMHYSEDSDGTPFPVVFYHANQSAHQFSEELRVSRDFEHLHWTSGIYFLDIDGDTATPTDLPEYAIDLLPSWNLKTRSFALFSQGDWQFAENWTLSLGGRWTHDQKIFDYAAVLPPK